MGTKKKKKKKSEIGVRAKRKELFSDNIELSTSGKNLTDQWGKKAADENSFLETIIQIDIKGEEMTSVAVKKHDTGKGQQR